MTEADSTVPIVTLIGGSGFVGRYIAQAMAQKGWRVRVACRRPNEALFVKPYGAVGQVEPIQCNIRDDASIARVIQGATAVVNCVGILFESGKNKFDAIQAEGPGRVARLAKEAGVQRMVHISAIGADKVSPAAYARTKAAGENAVLTSFPDAVILRPSIVFGPEDQFFNRFAAMTRLSPMLPVIGADTRFQPVWVQDVAEAAAKAITSNVAPGIYELGGPNTYSFRELMELMLTVVRRKRLIVNIPFFAAKLQASFLQLLPNPPLTVDQVKLLGRDNVVEEGSKGFAELGLEPTAPEAIIESYLYAHRPYGQYTKLTEGGDGS
ncbi:MAG: complex I NDUFA9 subunit family protein [Pseudomonadota bacterium]